MTTTMGDTDIDVFTVLDFDPALPCDYKVTRSETCQNTAEWICVTSCCGKSILYCQKHFDVILDGISQGKKFVHVSCGAKDIKHPWSSAERISQRIS